MGRFLIQGKNFHILEDHDNLIQESIHDGPMDERHEKILWHLIHSGYFKVVHEDEVNEGHHDNLINELDIGPTEPDEQFILTGKEAEPQRVEIYGDVIILDGQKLEGEELNDFINKVREHTYKLTAI